MGNFLHSGLSIIIGTLMCLAPLSNPVSAAAAADYESYTFKLTQSTAAYQFWTTLPSEHVFKDSTRAHGHRIGSEGLRREE